MWTCDRHLWKLSRKVVWNMIRVTLGLREVRSVVNLRLSLGPLAPFTMHGLKFVVYSEQLVVRLLSSRPIRLLANLF